MSESDKARLTDDSVKAIKILAQKGFSAEQIARMTGVTKTTVRRLISPTGTKK